MTILMVNKFHYLRGGAERYYFDLMALLERHGHRVIPSRPATAVRPRPRRRLRGRH
jgi:hypothetical protein